MNNKAEEFKMKWDMKEMMFVDDYDDDDDTKNVVETQFSSHN